MVDSSDPDDGPPRDRMAETLGHRFDWEAVRPSAAVVEMVAIAADSETTSLEPLYDAVDPEALDGVIRRNGKREPARGPTVSFTYAGYDVTVGRAGEVTVTPSGPVDDDW